MTKKCTRLETLIDSLTFQSLTIGLLIQITTPCPLIHCTSIKNNLSGWNKATQPQTLLTEITSTEMRKSLALKQITVKKEPSVAVYVFPGILISLGKSCYVSGSITFHSFPDFLNLSESWSKKEVFVQHNNASLHSKLHQKALQLAPKGLDYTQTGTLPELCITNLWLWEVWGQSQRWFKDHANGFMKAPY